MAKKPSKTPPAPVAVEPVTKNKRGKKGARVETEEEKKARLANRAKVTSTSSWTGKLPHTLLHENCQKRKWNKVEYDMKKIGDTGMLAIAVLSFTDPKTKETLTVRMNDPTYDKKSGKGILTPQETPMEARHMAATVALCRIASNSNMHMTLPPNHRKLWYDLVEFRKKLLKENPGLAPRLFDPEPFKTLVADRKHKEVKEKERATKQQQAEKIQKVPTVITSVSAKSAPAAKNMVLKKRNAGPLDKRIIRFPQKVWDNATFVDFKESSRNLIELSLKSHIDWSSKKYEGNDDRQLLKNKLVSLGFREPHVKEALLYKDPLSFLLFNLPEDDLPSFFQKRQEDTKMRIEIASLPLKTQNMVSRLMESGVSYAEALYALECNNFDEIEAAGKLTAKLLAQPQEPVSEISPEESMDIWTQELESLQSIYTQSIEVLNEEKTCYTIKLIDEFSLKLKVYKTKNYPCSLPGLVVSTFDKKLKLPNYIKQIILTKLIDYISESGLLGDMLIYHAYEWLQENIAGIIDNPGSLLPESTANRHGVDRDGATRTGKGKSRKGKGAVSRPLTSNEIEKLKSDYRERTCSKRYASMMKQRSQLPAWKIQDVIVDLIRNNDVVLITGETGSGKSTQVVQFVLDYLMSKEDDFGNTKIICTQPRRISAIGLAERVSEERCTDCGTEVGYMIRGVNKTKPSTRIKFMTTGVLVRILQSSRDFLANTIVFIDEVHERSVDTDLIVILLKNLKGKVPGLKIVLMSATVNVDIFKKYFGQLGSCHIEGRTFPIQDHYLEEILKTLDFKIKRRNNGYNDFQDDDEMNENGSNELKPGADSNFFRSGQINYDLISSLTVHIHEKLNLEGNDGSIVIFLPGVGEINTCCRNIKSSRESQNFVVLPLHSALTPDAQKSVFKRFPGKRKIVVSTNIAETSITIDDCVATIDSGRVKTMFYDAKTNTTRLVETFVSKAEAKQRRGRAGRVRAGHSYKLFSKTRYEEMPAQPTAEIKRVPLESLYLSVKSMGIKDVVAFLGSGLDPPPLDALKKSEQLLTTSGLLSEEDNLLTELGKFIGLMPVMDHKHGKLLIYSIIFGCTDFGVNTVAVLSIGGSPFIVTQENRDEIKKLCQQYSSSGDLLAYVEVVRRYLSLEDGASRRKFMGENHLSFNKMKEITSSRAQLLSILKDIGFVPMSYSMGSSDYLNRNGNNTEIIKCILTGAFYPQVARIQHPDQKFINTSAGAIEKDPEARMIKYWIRNEEYINQLYGLAKDSEVTNTSLPATRAFLHPSSIFFSTKNDDVSELAGLHEMLSSEKPEKGGSGQNVLKAPFAVFNSSHSTNKLYLRDITPTSTLALLLFGGAIKYDLQGTEHSPGIVVDNWLPVRTWCKNGVLLKELRTLLDNVIKQKLEQPEYNTSQESTHSGDDVLTIVEEIVKTESSNY